MLVRRAREATRTGPENPSWGEVAAASPAVAVASGKGTIANLARLAAENAQLNIAEGGVLGGGDAGNLDARDLAARAAAPAKPSIPGGFRRGTFFENATDVAPAARAPLEQEMALDATKRAEEAIRRAAEAKREEELVTPKNQTLPQKAFTSLVSSAPPQLAALGAGILTRSPALAMLIAGGGGTAMQAGSTYGDARDHLANVRTATRAAMVQGGIEALDALPIGIALKPGTATRNRFMDFLKKTGKTSGAEAGTEGLQQVAQDIDSMIEFDPNMTVGQMMENAAVAMMAGAAGGATIGAVAHAAEASHKTPQERMAIAFAKEIDRFKGFNPDEIQHSETTVPRGTPREVPRAEQTAPPVEVQPAGTQPPGLAEVMRTAVQQQQAPTTEPAVNEPDQERAASAAAEPELVAAIRRMEGERTEPTAAPTPAAQAFAQAMSAPSEPRPMPHVLRTPEQVAQRVQRVEGTPVQLAPQVPAQMQRSATLLAGPDRRVVFVAAAPEVYEGSTFHDDPNTVVVNVNSPRWQRRLIMHELTHGMRRTHPDVFRELSRALAPVINARRASERYGSIPAYEQLPAGDQAEEFVADLRGDFADEPAFWVEVFKHSKAPLVPRIVRLLRQLLDTLLQRVTTRGKRMGYNSKDLVTDIDAVRTALAKAEAAFNEQAPRQQPVARFANDTDGHVHLVDARAPPSAESATHSHSAGGERRPPPPYLVAAIHNYSDQVGGVQDRHGATDVTQMLARDHKAKLIRMIDHLPKDARPTLLLHKGDKDLGIPTVWLLGWSTKEGTDVHDHAGSEVGISVLRGEVRERAFGVRGKKLAREVAKAHPEGVEVVAHDREVREGSSMSLKDPYIHEVFGKSDDDTHRDVTVHAYFPPLTKMTYFKYDEANQRLTYDGEWDEAAPPPEGTRKSAPGTRDFTKRESGEIVGGFGAKSATAALRRMETLTKQGLAGKDWYSQSADSMIKAFGGDKNAADRFAQVLGIASAGTEVKANFTMAANALEQFSRGEPIHVGTGVKDKAISDLLYHGKEWAGRKTNDFYLNLAQYITGEKVNRPVQDRHQFRIASGDNERSQATARQYEFGADLTKRVAAKLGLTGDQAQAAMWVAKKAQDFVKTRTGTPKYASMSAAELKKLAMREALTSFGSEIEKRNWRPPPGLGFPGLSEVREAHKMLTAEVKPSTSTEIGKQAASLTIDKLRDFQKGALQAVGGVDSFMKLFGLDSTKYTADAGTGGYAGGVAPNLVASIKGERSLIDKIAKGWMYVFKQDAVPYFKAEASMIDDADATRGVFVKVDGIITDVRERKFYEHLVKNVHADIGFTREGNTFMVMNYHGQPVEEFLQKMDAALSSADNPLKVTEALDYGAKSTYPTHDWAQDPSGAPLLDQASAGLAPAVRDGLRSRADSFERYASSALGERATKRSAPGSRRVEDRRNVEVPAEVRGKDQSPLSGTPEYEAAEASAQKIFSNFEQASRDYEAMPQTKGGKILNPDMAAELVPEYRANQELAGATHEAASKFVKEYYAKRLQRPATGEGVVVFTAGGPGSGKSTAIAKLGDVEGEADLFYDSSLSRFTTAVNRIDSALAADRSVQVLFVDRDPAEAFEYGVISRIEKGSGRRVVPILEHARAHVGARQVVKQLAEHYAENQRVNIDVVRNNGQEVQQVPVDQVVDFGYKDALESVLQATARAYSAGRINDHQLLSAAGSRAESIRSAAGERRGQDASRRSAPGPRNWNVDQPGVADALIRAFQNNKLDLKAVQDAIREAGGIIQSATDPYLTEELAKSRYSERIKRYDNQLVKPLLRMIQQAKLTAEDVGRFLWARHAPEANAKLAQLNPGLADPSGMSDAEARKVMDQFRAAGKMNELSRIADHVDAMIRATRTLYVQEGLESQKTVDEWANTYKHYVPLHREIDNPAPGPGKGFKVIGPETKRRLGSQRPAVAILAAIITKHHNAIIRAEKARVGRDLIKLAEAYPNEDFWRVDQPPLQRYVNPSSGLVEMRIDPQYKQREDVFVVKEKDSNGNIVERVLTFNPHNERAMRLSHSMQNLDVAEMTAITRIVGKATRFLANLATQWNPIFWATNLARDVGTMSVNLQSTPLAGKAPRVMVRMPAAMAGIADATWRSGNSKYAKLWKEFADNGGPTGFYKFFENIAEHQLEIEKMVKQLDRSNGDPRVWAHWFGEQISNVNSIIENSTRLAVYALAREKGLSEREAASVAKNITVNFDRRGNLSLSANAWYMFFNANAQGTARLLQTLATSPRGRATVGALTAAGAAMWVINMLIGDHDKDEYGNNPYELIADWEKERNWIFMLPKSHGKGTPVKNDKGQIIGRYVKVPLPYGFNIFPTFGRLAAEAAFTAARSSIVTERRSTLDMAGDFGNVVIDAFSPLGQVATPIQTIAPTIADPFVQIWENKKFTGTAMVPDRSQYNQQVPRSQLYFNSNSELAKDLAAWLNRTTGGDDIRPGALDVYPGHIEHTFSTLTGGPGTFAMGWLDWGTNITRRAMGHDVEPTRTSRIPFVGKFYGEVDERNVEAKFFRIKKKADEQYGRYRALRKAGEIDEADKIEAENPALIDFAREVSKSTFRKEQKELRNEMKGTRELPIVDRAQAKDQIRREQSELYQRALEAYNAAASEGR